MRYPGKVAFTRNSKVVGVESHFLCIKTQGGVATDLARKGDYYFRRLGVYSRYLQSSWEIPMRLHFRGNLIVCLGHAQSLYFHPPQSPQIERMS